MKKFKVWATKNSVIIDKYGKDKVWEIQAGDEQEARIWFDKQCKQAGANPAEGKRFVELIVPEN